MKQLSRREFLQMATMTTTAALLAACGATQVQPQAEPAEPQEAQQAQEEAPAEAPAAEKTPLLVWDGFGANSAFVGEIVKMFSEANPDIEVTREDQPNMRDILKTSLDGGVGPHVMYYDTGPGFAGVLARANLLLPLDEAYDQYGWTDRIFPIARERTTFDNKIYGIGNELEFIGVFYNKRLFEEQGLAEPESHDDFLDLAEKIKAANLIPVAFADQDKWPAGHMLSVFGGYIAGKDKLAAAISGEVPWNDPDFVEAIQTFFVDMNQAGYFIPEVNAVTYDDANLLFYGGQAAMNLTGSWMIGDYTNPEVMPDPVGFFFYPPIQGKPIAPPAGLGSGYFVSKATPDPQAAFRFLDFLFSDEAAKLWIEKASVIPPVAVDVDAVAISDLLRFVMINLQENAALMGYNIDVLTPDNFNTMMFDGFQEVLAGTKTAQEQADDLENAMAEAREAGSVMDITP